MKVWHPAIAAIAVGFFACSGGDEVSEETPEDTGRLDLALIGTGSDGVQYRLRNAEFRIEGYPDYYDESPYSGGEGGSFNSGYYLKVVSSETNPDAPTISEQVIPGYYYVDFLSTDWYIEALRPSGPERVDQAILLSSRFQYAYVGQDSSTTVVYRFGVDGTLIDFRSGTLSIAIDIERPEDRDSYGGYGGWGGVAGSGW